MVTDKELLKLAAKAAGIEVVWGKWLSRYEWLTRTNTGDLRPWNPLVDGGDALRLAVMLGININFGDGGDGTVIAFDFTGRFEDCEECGDPLIATCRAIVRAAAGIGRSMG